MAASSVLLLLEIPEGCEDQGKRFQRWQQKFESYLLMSGLSEKDEKYQMAALVTCLDSNALEVYNALTFANASYKGKLDPMMKLMEERYIGEVNKIYERFAFFQERSTRRGTLRQLLHGHVNVGINV